ncbi:MAG: hypothetical protein DMG24_10815 [Acidobacteria bacterium]|nr:MAG: hypothetical protein DMG24_10815 [Acidobacteriota bacterium]
MNERGAYLPINRRRSPSASTSDSYNGSPNPLWFLDESSTVSVRFAWLQLDYVTSLRNAKWKSAQKRDEALAKK